MSDVPQYQVLVEPVESFADGYQVNGIRFDRKFLGSGMDPLDVVDALPLGNARSFVQHLWFDVDGDDFVNRWREGQRKPAGARSQIQDQRVVSHVCIAFETG